jgi:hypothetical protein
MASKSLPNGTADAPIELLSSFAPVVGINFGNSFASIAVLTKVRFYDFFLSYGRSIERIWGYRRDWLSVLLMKMGNARLLVQLRSRVKKW